MTDGEETAGDPGLRQELLELAKADQAARLAWLADRSANEARLQEVDNRSAARLRDIVAARGWPGRSLVGADGAWAAWLLAQHADHDRSLQAMCLGLIEAAVRVGEADPQPCLQDRVAVAEGRPQRYGTQFNDHGEPEPIEDPEQIDERRQAVGLSTLAAHAEHIHTIYKR